VDQPKVLLLDEPFSGLDIVTKRALQEQLLRALAKQPATVLMVSHSVEDAVFMSDSIHVLTPAPMAIARTFSIGLSRPRDPASRAFVETVAEISAFVAGDARHYVNGARSDDERARRVARG
jgi:NitT/TauT family transport system ATP-binding protein